MTSSSNLFSATPDLSGGPNMDPMNCGRSKVLALGCGNFSFEAALMLTSRGFAQASDLHAAVYEETAKHFYSLYRREHGYENE